MRILIVEDDRETLNALRKLFAIKFPSADIHTATTVAAAKELIDLALASRSPYGIVVLDLKLPLQEGWNAEVDSSVSELIWTRMREAVVALISGFPTALQGQFDWFAGRKGQVVMQVSKEPEWADTLIKRLWSYLIEHQMDDLFGVEATARMSELGARSAGEPPRLRCLTHPLAALQGEIVEHWCDLDETTRRRVKSVFYVDDTVDPVVVSVALPESYEMESTSVQNETKKQRSRRKSTSKRH